MTKIAFLDGKVLMVGAKVGEGAECCCKEEEEEEEECDCGENCTQLITVEVTYEDITDTVEAAPGGFDTGGGAGQSAFIFVDLSSTCGNYGPNGECGWLVEIYICGCDDPTVTPFFCGPLAQTWQAFVPYDNNGCPEVGQLTFNCIGGTCDATIAGEVT